MQPFSVQIEQADVFYNTHVLFMGCTNEKNAFKEIDGISITVLIICLRDILGGTAIQRRLVLVQMTSFK